jgi:3D (Asp-Asp-Asp) domain-containing protein
LVTVTGYTSCPSQTDDTPNLTATLDPTRPGTLALSQDLLRTFTPGAPYDFGDRVLIPGMGIYVVEDTMHPRWERSADIWFHDNETARRWGRREAFLTKVDADDPMLVAERWHPSAP